MIESNILLLENYIFNINAVPSLLTALLIFVLGFAIFIREKASYVGWLYLLYSAPLFIWFTGVALLNLSISQDIGLFWAKFSNSGIVFIPPTFFLLSTVILNEYSRYKSYVVLSWLISIAVFLLLLFSDNYILGIHQYTWGYFVSYGTFTIAFLVFFSIMVLRTFYMYWESYLSAPEKSVAKKRSKFLLIGFLIGFLASVDFLPAYGVDIYPFGFIFISLLFLNTTYVVWHLKFVDITPEFISMQILETMGESLIVLDTDNIIRLINAAACKQLNSKKNLLLNHDVETVIPEINFKKINQLLITKAQLSPYNVQINSNNTGTIHLELNASVLYDKANDTVGYLYIMHDVTLQYEAENVLRRDKDELKEIIRERTEELITEKEYAEKSSMAKSHFLSSMSHELRNPLNAILGFSQLLMVDKNEKLTEHQESYVSQVIESGEQLLHLITGVLDLSKTETENIDIKLEELNLNEILIHIIEKVNLGSAKQKGIEIINGNQDSSINVIADKMRLLQVFFNLLSNAVKYNSVKGTVNISVKETPDNMVRILITDTGIGIKQENLNRVFDPFERLDFSHGVIEGSGVGLTVTKRLVEAMQGKIGLESTYGQGTTFWVELQSA